MFTGIIEELGKIHQMKSTPQAMELSIHAKKILEDVRLGDSISVNGVCLTVTSFTSNAFTVDVMPETVKASSIQQLQVGSTVNLERSMAANGRFGGHFVSGHIDGVAKIVQIRQVANAVYMDLEVPKELLKNCLVKGSITLDGTSLTVFNVTTSLITVSLIPHTYKETVLGMKKVGNLVNVETDLIGKYILQHLTNSQTKNLSMDFLQQHGF
ncbi:riboflavin synthase [Solibacillus sp. R5-41]|uniref:riboflavin synthase n=1 Tax=Solibacillus sp. R5-41 TaxID=2048654 RepID=UPI000C127E16|nr:riboflavin synthase [Solibacillus sp. R5-41]ATP40649.1 riboflavin synthase [Solibacillus sp. R5-41]